MRYVVSGGDSSYQSNILVAGANLWNGHHSRIALSQNSSGAKMSVYKWTSTTPGLLGKTYSYYRYLGVLYEDKTATRVWDCTDVYIYDNQCVNLGLTSVANKKSVICHEVGHVLSLAHQKDSQVSIMDITGKVAVAYTRPQTIDDNNLKLKWGY